MFHKFLAISVATNGPLNNIWKAQGRSHILTKRSIGFLSTIFGQLMSFNMNDMLWHSYMCHHLIVIQPVKLAPNVLSNDGLHCL